MISNRIKEFFDAIWSDDAGMRIIGTKSAKGKFDTVAHNTNAEAVQCAEDAIRDGKECFFGVHLFSRDRRKAEDAAGCRALYLDIDVSESKDGYYRTQVEALGAVKGFLDNTGLPEPSIVSSGVGLHLYWIFREMLSEDRWSHAAKQLDSLCKVQGLKADSVVTADRARVLRMPGSLNRKSDPDNAMPCEIWTSIETLSFDNLQAILSKSTPLEFPNSDLSINDTFLGGLVLNSESEQGVARLCMPFLSAERCVGYDDWLSVGIALHNMFSGGSEGLQLWDDFSKQGAGYKHGVCPQKWEGFGERSDGEKLSVGSLVHWAKTDGGTAFEVAWDAYKAERRVETLAARATEIQLTDAGNAERLVSLFGDSIRYDDRRKLWFAWNGSFWAEGAESDVMRYALSTVKAMYIEAGKSNDDNYRQALAKHARKSESAASLKAMIEVAKSDPLIRCTVADFDSHSDYLNVKNGVIDLRTGGLLPHSREFMMSNCVGIDYDLKAKCPTYEMFLSRIFAGNIDTVGFVQRAVGYSLTGGTSEHAYFLCYGEGSNGKSTLFTAVRELLGDLAGTLRTEAIMNHKFTSNSGHSDDVARLLGKRFVSASETEGGKHIAEATIKQLTGGDTISASRKGRSGFDFKPTFKLWITANHKPSITGTDEGIWRRTKFVPFNVCIPKEERDGGLDDKLRSEYSGILAWAVRGAVKWYAEGLGNCNEVDAATEEYRNEQNTVSNFIAECCEVGNGLNSAPAILYDEYKRHCIDNGLEPVNRNQFPKEMEKLGYTKARIKRGMDDRTLWQGIQLQTGSSFGISAAIH